MHLLSLALILSYSLALSPIPLHLHTFTLPLSLFHLPSLFHSHPLFPCFSLSLSFTPSTRSLALHKSALTNLFSTFSSISCLSALSSFSFISLILVLFFFYCPNLITFTLSFHLSLPGGLVWVCTHSHCHSPVSVGTALTLRDLTPQERECVCQKGGAWTGGRPAEMALVPAGGL